MSPGSVISPMSRSADSALLTTALAACLLTVTAGAATAGTSTADRGGPTAAAPTPIAVAGYPRHTTLAGLDAPVLDIVLTVTTIDGTATTVDQGATRRLVLASSVLFAESSPHLSPQALATLTGVARQIRTGGVHGTITVNGYTDDQGSAAIGLVLSRRRAAAVTAVLAAHLQGMDLAFVQHGWGEAHPIAPNEYVDGSPDRAGQARNRRVEIVFTPGTTHAR
jgi:outer membrane protein OmpA-like peptidoglycan-associated protein